MLMKSSEMLKMVLVQDMPDMEFVRKRCIGELHGETTGNEKTNPRKTVPGMHKMIYAGTGICALVLLCVLLSSHTDAQSLIARLQTWLHINNERVTVGEMKKDSIRIPEDTKEVEYGGEKYLTKSYSSPEELEEDIGKHLKIWRRADGFEQNRIVLDIVEREYARAIFVYDISRLKVKKYANNENEMNSVECYITIPLSDSFSMNNIKLEDQFLKDAVLDSQGRLIRYGENSEYSLLETYYSEQLDTDISVIGKQRGIDINEKKEDATDVAYLYFVQEGLSYQINCNTNIEMAKDIVEKLR